MPKRISKANIMSGGSTRQLNKRSVFKILGVFSICILAVIISTWLVQSEVRRRDQAANLTAFNATANDLHAMYIDLKSHTTDILKGQYSSNCVSDNLMFSSSWNCSSYAGIYIKKSNANHQIYLETYLERHDFTKDVKTQRYVSKYGVSCEIGNSIINDRANLEQLNKITADESDFPIEKLQVICNSVISSTGKPNVQSGWDQ